MSCPQSVIFRDLRDYTPKPAPRSRVGADGRTVLRDPKTITGITIHQTAVNFGVGRKWLRMADGDEQLAQQLRAINVPSHMLAFREGWLVQAHDLRAYLHHAHRLNGPTLGLEIEGYYGGLDRMDFDRRGREYDELDDLTIETAREGVRRLAEGGQEIGAPIEFIYAHRQSANKPADPGEEIWKHVVLQYATPRLGLKPRHDFVVGNGRPIPREWDPAARAPY